MSVHARTAAKDFPRKSSQKERVFCLFRVNCIPFILSTLLLGAQWTEWSYRKQNRSQKNTNTLYSEYSYSGLVPKEHAPNFYKIVSRACKIPEVKMPIKIAQTGNKTCTKHLFLSRNFAFCLLWTKLNFDSTFTLMTIRLYTVKIYLISYFCGFIANGFIMHGHWKLTCSQWTVREFVLYRSMAIL